MLQTASSSRTISAPRRLLILSLTSQSQSTIPALLQSLTGVPVTAPAASDSKTLSVESRSQLAPSESTSSPCPPDTTQTTTPPSPSTPTAAVAAAATVARTTTYDFSPAPSPSPSPSLAGYTSHAPLRIRTKYYAADIPIWVDEIPDPYPCAFAPHPSSSSGQPERQERQEPSLSQWKAEFSSAEAQLVRDAIGAVIVCVQNPDSHGDGDGDAGLRQLLWQQIRSRRSEGESGDGEGSLEGTVAQLGDGARQREDVRGVLDVVKAVVDVKAQIERERGGTGTDVGEVPGLLVLMERGRRKRGSGGGGIGARTLMTVENNGVAQDQNKEKRGPSRVKDGDLGYADGHGGYDDTGDLTNVDDEILTPFTAAWWEEQLFDMGVMEFEVVSWDPKRGEVNSRNAFGEFEGMRRIREVLETHEWSAVGDSPQHAHPEDHFDQSLLGGDDESGFNLEVNELEREMLGLRMAIEHGDDDSLDGLIDLDGTERIGDEDDDELKVDSLETLMMRMKTIKAMSEELPENERKKFAMKAVRDIMREL